MNNKLVCPFCGGKLYCSDNCYVCLNDQCIFCDFHFMEKRWNAIIELKQALIQAKQDLEIARYAITDVFSYVKEHEKDIGGCAVNIVIKLGLALTQIKHKE